MGHFPLKTVVEATWTPTLGLLDEQRCSKIALQHLAKPGSQRGDTKAHVDCGRCSTPVGDRAWLTCWGIQVKGLSEADPWALVYWKNPPTCYKNRQVPPQHFEAFRNKADPWPCAPRQESGEGSLHTNPASEGHCNTEIAWGEKTFPACLHAQQVLLCQKDKAPNPLICLLKF